MALSLLASLAIGTIVGAAAGAGAKAIPTSTSKANKERLAELQRLQQQGNLGITDRERAVLEQGLLSPARTAAREQRLRSGQQLAASGMTQPTEILRSQQLSEETQGQAAIQASSAIAQEDLRRARAQEQEIEDRLQQKGDRQRSIVKGALTGAAQGASLAGASKLKKDLPALRQQTAADTSLLIKAGFSDADIATVIRLSQNNPELITEILGTLGTSGEGS